jgi:hypothetical protein
MAAQLLGDVLGQLIAFAFAPPKGPDPAALAAQQRAAEEAQRKWEAQQQSLRNQWKARQGQADQERQKTLGQRQQQGQELLARMQGDGGTPAASEPLRLQPLGSSIESFKFDAPSAAVPRTPSSAGRYDTAGLDSGQRLLCAASFSQRALAIVGQDPEQARFLEEQATRVSAGEAVEVPCSLPELPPVPEPPRPDPESARTIETIELVQTHMENLHVVEAGLKDVRSQRSSVEADVRGAEAAKVQIEAAKAQARPDDATLMAEILRRLAEAQSQLDEANRKLESLTTREEELLQQKETIRVDLQSIQRELQSSGTAAP